MVYAVYWGLPHVYAVYGGCHMEHAVYRGCYMENAVYVDCHMVYAVYGGQSHSVYCTRSSHMMCVSVIRTVCE